MAKAKQKGGTLVPAADRQVRDMTLAEFGKSRMRTYGDHVNHDRQIPDFFDGLKPVHRRIMWATSQQPKGQWLTSARIVGDTIGKYHPHGDNSVYDAMCTMVNASSPLLSGDGNWGSLVDGAAAMRYTSARLSNYGLTYFDQDYINREVTTFIPNYDDIEIEPVVLPAQLPHVLLDGGEGTGYGGVTKLPSFTPESVIEVLIKLLNRETLQVKDFARILKPASVYGGQLVNSKENKEGWLSMFESPEGRVVFESKLAVDQVTKSIVIDNWASGVNLEKLIPKIRALPECQRAQCSKGTTVYTIECKRDYNLAQFDKFVAKVQKLTQSASSYKMLVTERQARIEDGRTIEEKRVIALSVPELIVKWIKARLDLELRSLAFRTKKQEQAIAYSELLIKACDKLDIVRDSLKSKDPDQYLVKHLKITAEQAAQILELKVRQLSKMDQTKMKEKLAEQRKFATQLERWTKKPRTKVLLDLERVREAIEKDRKFEKTRAEQEFEAG